MSPPLFLLDEVPAGDVVELAGDEGRHAATVRRIGVGELVQLADGRGQLAECVVLAAGPASLTLTVTSRRTVEEPVPSLTVIQALPKGERGELAVSLLTEAGVDEIIPWAASRCVAQWRGPRGDKALARWRAAAREAAKQSRRARVPQITELHTTRQVCARLGSAGTSVVLHESARQSLGASDWQHTESIAVVVGPEGGLTDGEVLAFRATGARVARLGPDVFRTSSAGLAAIAVLSTLTGRWGEMSAPTPTIRA